MNIIDWVGVAKNALWILGLAVMLAAFSYADWWASVQHMRRRSVFGSPRFVAPFSAGMTLFCAGLAATATRWWETAAWTILGLVFAVQAIAAARAGNQPAEAERPPDDSPDSSEGAEV